MTIVLVSGSPSLRSRSQAILDAIAARIEAAGQRVDRVALTDVPADDLIQARHASEAAIALAARFGHARAVVIATPVYKASLGGGLKALLDLLPQTAFADKIVLPIATGGSAGHQLALDFGLKPVVAALGAQHVLPGIYACDAQVRLLDHGCVDFADDIVQRIDRSTAQLLEHLALHERLARIAGDADIIAFPRARPLADRSADLRCSA